MLINFFSQSFITNFPFSLPICSFIKISMSDRSITVTVAGGEKFDEWESTECRTPTSPSCRIAEPMTCPPTPMISSPHFDYNATEENFVLEFTGCKTPTTPSCRIPKLTLYPPTPMISSPCHDFNAAEEELDLEFTECKTPTEPCCRIQEPLTCPPAPMISSPRHDFTNKLFIFPLKFEEAVSAAVDQ